VCRKLGRAGQLGSQGHQAYVTLRCLKEPVEYRNVRREKVLGWMHAALGMG
jgi:hypothetical protein